MREFENIDKNAHYFILMHPIEGFITPFGSITYTSSSTREKWVECKIVEERYKLADGYKIELRSLEKGYGKNTYYLEDFISLLASGHIVKKTEDLECVEEYWQEPLTDTVNLKHSAFVLKKSKTTKKQINNIINK